MSDPFRIRVQKKLTEALESVTTTLDATSMTGKVFRGRAWFGDKDPLPMISILEEPIPPEGLSGPAEDTGTSTPYTLIIQGFVKDDPDNPTDPAHFLLADVKKALAAERKNAGSAQGVFQFGTKYPMIQTLEIGSGVVRPPDELSAKAYFWLTLTLGLVEDDDDGYA